MDCDQMTASASEPWKLHYQSDLYEWNFLNVSSQLLVLGHYLTCHPSCSLVVENDCEQLRKVVDEENEEEMDEVE
jgi:hypothetical protein